jgi:hypothetical protein
LKNSFIWHNSPPFLDKIRIPFGAKLNRVTRSKRPFAHEQLRITGVTQHREALADVVLSAFTQKKQRQVFVKLAALPTELLAHKFSGQARIEHATCSSTGIRCEK